MRMEERIAKIQAARALIQAALAECDAPQIEMMLRNADMELHWALWNLGVSVELRPEIEYPQAEQSR
jgi:hypothetical protein